MSGGTRDKRGGGGGGGRGKTVDYASAKSREDAPPAPPPGLEFKPPLKPHRGLFILLCVVLAVWVGVLLVMYFKTVYPQRHGGRGSGFSLLVDSDFR